MSPTGVPNAHQYFPKQAAQGCVWLPCGTSFTDSWALTVQSSAVVVFQKPATRQKVLDAAQAKQLVQLKLQEPERAYGLKGTL